MQKIRYFLALWCAKAAKLGLKIFRRSASTFPGALALKICPNFLYLSKRAPKAICVTGTNGKTTVTNMTAETLRKCGYRVETNAMGANIATGIATVLINSVNIFGKVHEDVQVFEVDERYSRLILPAIRPEYLVVTNIFRDSLKRNGHPEYIFSIMDTYTPETATVILNADDLCSSQLLPGNKRVFYGIGKMDGDVTEPYNLISDHTICPKCHAKLKFNYLRYHHIGNAYCPNCDFKSAEADYLVESIDEADRTMTVRHNGQTAVYPLVNPILYNVYNELAVVTALAAFGIPEDKLRSVMKRNKVVASRLDATPVGDAVLIKAMAKGQSAVSSCRTLDFLSGEKGNKSVVLVIDDYYERQDSSEFIGWIYDTDFEFLSGDDVKEVLCLGPRCEDYRVRLLMAGVPAERILCGAEEFSTVKKMKTEGIERIYVLYDTSTYDLACRVADSISTLFTEKAKGGETA